MNTEMKRADLLSNLIDQINAGVEVLVDELGRQYEADGQYIGDLLAASEPWVALRSEAVLPAHYKNAAIQKLKQHFSVAKTPSRSIQGVTQAADYLFLVLKKAGRVFGATRLQKLMFLIGQEGNALFQIPQFYKHRPDNFGAFDSEIIQQAEVLKRDGFLVIEATERRREADNSLVDDIYRLTKEGQRIAGELEAWARANKPEVLEGVSLILNKYGKMPLDDLLQYVYEKYPDTTDHSQIRDRYLPRRDANKEKGNED